MPDRVDRDRVIGALAFAGSGIAFLVAVAFLYRAEGPGSPDILVTLASPAGRGLFNGFVAAGIVAAILYAVGLTALTTTLRDSDRLPSRAALVLGVLAASTLIGLLAFQFALTAVAREGLVTTSSFRPLTVLAHAYADAAGWTAIVLLALSAVIASLTFPRGRGWSWLWVAGLALAPICLVLFLMDASYLFLLPFALWEIGLGLKLLLVSPDS